jgi:hypothetical protein
MHDLPLEDMFIKNDKVYVYIYIYIYARLLGSFMARHGPLSPLILIRKCKGTIDSFTHSNFN